MNFEDNNFKPGLGMDNNINFQSDSTQNNDTTPSYGNNLSMDQICQEVENLLTNMSAQGSNNRLVKQSTNQLGHFFERDDSVLILLKITATSTNPCKNHIFD